jgi:hypothetical protein
MASKFLHPKPSTAAWACLLLAMSVTSCRQQASQRNSGETEVGAGGAADVSAQGASPKSLALTNDPGLFANIPTVQVGYLDSRKALEVVVPEGVRFTEISADGHFAGTGDVGEDVVFTKLFVSHESHTYVGAQTLKIGSADRKSRAVHWSETGLGELLSREAANGYDKTHEWGKNGKERVTSPKLSLVENGSGTALRYEEVAELRNSQEWWSFAVTIRHFY